MDAMAKRSYTEEEIEGALDLYADHGPSAASKLCGIPAKTISSWAQRRGRSADADQKREAAVEKSKLSRAQKRELLKEKLLDKAVSLLDQMDGELTIVTKSGDPLDIPMPPNGQKDLAVALGIIIDKFRLEMGEAPPGSASDDEFRGFLFGMHAQQQRSSDQAAQSS